MVGTTKRNVMPRNRNRRIRLTWSQLSQIERQLKERLRLRGEKN